MRSTKYFLFLIATLFCLHSSAQSLKEQFARAFTKDDTITEIKILAAWSQSAHDDPDRYVYAFNYYVKRGLPDILSLTTTKPAGGAYELKDKNNNTAGYLGNATGFNPQFINQGLACIDSAIIKFPNRLDMRFGKVYVLKKISDYDKFTDEIVKAVEYGQTINNQWLWRDGKPLDDPEKSMLSTVQSYFLQLYGAGDENAPNMRRIAEAILKYYPDNVENLSDLSITYIIGKEYDKALPYLLRAEKIAPEDYIILNNIGYCYEQRGSKQNAIKYYELVVKNGTDEAKKDAAQRIKKLKGD